MCLWGPASPMSVPPWQLLASTPALLIQNSTCSASRLPVPSAKCPKHTIWDYCTSRSPCHSPPSALGLRGGSPGTLWFCGPSAQDNSGITSGVRFPCVGCPALKTAHICLFVDEEQVQDLVHSKHVPSSWTVPLALVTEYIPSPQ